MANNKKNKIYKCPFCSYKYKEKQALYNHMEKEHKDQLNGLTPAHCYFNIRNKKDHGSCIICKKETEFNEATEKYERLCSDACRKKYRQLYKERMEKAGKDPDKFLNDPEQQKKMLERRKISGTYVWADGSKTKYNSSYEKDFIEFMETFFPDFKPSDLMAPAPQIFEYTFEGKQHFYIPDFYITSLDLIIEIKAGDNKHYRERDLGKEEAKDSVVGKSNHNYIKILDKEYDEFYNLILNFDFE